MDIGKQRKPTVDAKYLHAFSPSPLSQNGQHGLRHPVEGMKRNLNYCIGLFRHLCITRIIRKVYVHVGI